MKKSIFAGLVTAAMAASMIGGVAQAEEVLESTVIWDMFNDTYESGFRIIMQNEADAMGTHDLTMQDANGDSATVVNDLELALTKGVTSIAILPTDSESTEQLAQMCVEAEVPVVFFNKEPAASTMAAYEDVYYVGAPASDSGIMSAQVLIDYWNADQEKADKNGDGVMQVVVIQGALSSQDTTLRTEGYTAALDESGIDYEIIECDTADWSKTTAMEKLTAWLTNYGTDGIDGVLCNNDEMAMGALAAAQSAGMNDGGDDYLPIVGIDANLENLQAMQEGQLLGTVMNDRQNQSIAILNILTALAAGDEITEETVGVECTVEDNYIWIPYVAVSSDNLQDCIDLMTSIAVAD